MDQTPSGAIDMEQNPEFVTVPQAANILHLASSFVYQLIQRKEIPFFRVGRKIWLRKEDVEKFLKKHYQVPKNW
jgi:excisionase family DNA binding protein